MAPPTPSLAERIERLEARHELLRKVMMRSFWQTMDRLDDITLPGRRMTCPICDRAEAREHLELRVEQCMFGGGRLERYKCPGCGCIYGPAKFLDLSPEMVGADYELLYDGYAEGNSTEAEVRAFRSLEPRNAGPYLNWGCGRWSQSITALRAEGFDVWGFEPSAPPGGEPFVATSRDAISARFAGIFSNNVIEHLIRPVDDFRYFHSILEPGGRMAHASPCYEYRYAFTRFHVIFLTGDAPQVLAERSGFRLVGREEDGEFMNCVFERA
jgi:SAM-dependent methyltransferase